MLVLRSAGNFGSAVMQVNSLDQALYNLIILLLPFPLFFPKRRHRDVFICRKSKSFALKYVYIIYV